MITVAADGVAKAVRIAVGSVGGRLWSSGTQTRLRTRRLREDPRCTLYVHDESWFYLTLETTVTLMEGPEVPAQTLALFRQFQGKPEGPVVWYGEEHTTEEFLARMVEENRLLYQFEVHRAYGLIGP